MLVPVDRELSLFGNRTRTLVLSAVRLLEETYPSELATMLGLGPFSVQRALESMEREGVVTSRLMGRTRLVRLNPKYFAAAELSALLWALGKKDEDLQRKLATKRRRPRRAGKKL
jgi:DNA-binding transcriptional ArsR family regulator